jgi:hypothetical protein
MIIDIILFQVYTDEKLIDKSELIPMATITIILNERLKQNYDPISLLDICDNTTIVYIGTCIIFQGHTAV